MGGIAQQPPQPMGWGRLRAEAPLRALAMGRGPQEHGVARGKALQLSAVMKGSSPNEKAAVHAASFSCEAGTRLRAKAPNGFCSNLGHRGCTALAAETPNKSICPVFC